METITLIAALSGCAISLFSLLTLGTKSGRKLFNWIFKRGTADIVKIDEAQTEKIERLQRLVTALVRRADALESVAKQYCRSTLKGIYYTYEPEKRLPLYQRKTADDIYEVSDRDFNWNGYISLLYEQIRAWEIDTTQHNEEGLI